MPQDFYPALFFFLAAGAVSLFTFISVAAFASIRAQEREARDRIALLKTLAEQPTDAAKLVLDEMRQRDERRHEQKGRDQISGGLAAMATGVGLIVMFSTLVKGEQGVWTIGMIPLLVGATMVAGQMIRRPKRG